MVKVNVTGLDPTAMYTILLEFVQIEQHRLVSTLRVKFIFFNSDQFTTVIFFILIFQMEVRKW